MLFLLNYTQKTHKKQEKHTPKVLTFEGFYVIMYIVKEQRAQLFDHPFYVFCAIDFFPLFFRCIAFNILTTYEPMRPGSIFLKKEEKKNLERQFYTMMLQLFIDIFANNLYLKRVNVSPVIFEIMLNRLIELKHYDEKLNIISKFLDRADLEVSYIVRNLSDPRFIVMSIEHFPDEDDYYFEDDDFTY